jgi:hypothetical protein
MHQKEGNCELKGRDRPGRTVWGTEESGMHAMMMDKRNHSSEHWPSMGVGSTSEMERMDGRERLESDLSSVTHGSLAVFMMDVAGASV